jgi:micrococcal nuclease
MNTKQQTIRTIIYICGVFLLGLGIGRLSIIQKENTLLGKQKKAEISKEATQSSVGTKHPNRVEATVTRVIDGDTIELSDGSRVRYIGINTPETVDPRKTVECFGREASDENKRLVDSRTVLLEKDVSETDEYGRLLRYVYVDGRMINDHLVRQGFARVSTFPPDVAYKEQFLTAEREARENNRGLWAGCPSTIHTTIVPSAILNAGKCMIKGNISASGDKIYHISGCGSYDKTSINENTGERWFCTEKEAQDAGWRKAKNCP